MCGIVGFLQINNQEKNYNNDIINAMMSQIRHRGPDDSGFWMEEGPGVVLGHRRLSIIDLSPEGRQPMLSADNKFVISFNGEIYNFQELRSELENTFPPSCLGWRGHSDTEVLLAALSNWGLDKTLDCINGMFAFALWDRKDKVLHLVRDRIGEKPLYYGQVKNTFVFGSELKSLRAHPEWDGQISRAALSLYMRYGYIPAPYSIYEGIYKLLPGSFLSYSLQKFSNNEKIPVPIRYWSPQEIGLNNCENSFLGSDNEAICNLNELLIDAVRIRMVSDVPLGAFLSGGIDSSTVVAIMQGISSKPVKTFTIGFSEDEYNEAQNAKQIAQFLGTDHTELMLTGNSALGVIPDLHQIYDEPFADSSAIPTFLVSKLAREKVTVSLSGDGGDELFGGYNRYRACKNLWDHIGWLPFNCRLGLSKILAITPPIILDNFMGWMAPYFNKYGRRGSVANKLHKLSEILAVHNPEELYLKMISFWKTLGEVILEERHSPSIFPEGGLLSKSNDIFQFMMIFDASAYLPDDILVKVDRASMRVGLEARVPILDHRIIEFAWKLPLHMKIRTGQGKWILRQVLHKKIPREMTERPKLGFAVPIGTWLRGPLRDWAENLLDERKLQDDNLFDPKPIRKKWQEHIACKQNWQGLLWSVLMFQAWFESHRVLKGDP